MIKENIKTKTELIKDITISLEKTTISNIGFIDANDYILTIKHNNKEVSVGTRYLYPEYDIEKVLKDLLRI